MWMDDLQFNTLFNTISVILGQWVGDNERLCAMWTDPFTNEEIGEGMIHMQDFYLCMFICTYAYMHIMCFCLYVALITCII